MPQPEVKYPEAVQSISPSIQTELASFSAISEKYGIESGLLHNQIDELKSLSKPSLISMKTEFEFQNESFAPEKLLLASAYSDLLSFIIESKTAESARMAFSSASNPCSRLSLLEQTIDSEKNAHSSFSAYVGKINDYSKKFPDTVPMLGLQDFQLEENALFDSIKERESAFLALSSACLGG